MAVFPGHNRKKERIYKHAEQKNMTNMYSNMFSRY